MNICLRTMTLELAKDYFRDFSYHPSVFMDDQPIPGFEYSDHWVERYWNRQCELHRVHFAILLDERPIGEIILKKIHKPRGSCTLSIHLQNEAVMNRGFGTQAERLALEYGFEQLDMESVYADALHKNKRSQHVLANVGFETICEDASYVYFCCDRAKWASEWIQRP